jgi:GGDEF domain-containing protein
MNEWNDRRTDYVTRRRVAEMSPEEMRRALLVSEKTRLPNRRAFEEGEASPFVAMSDVNGLKTLNDDFGYSAGDVLIIRFAEVLVSVGLDAYHDKGDEFLCKGESYWELNRNLSEAQRILGQQPFAVAALDGRITTIPSAGFCFGIGTNLPEAERSLKHQKEMRKASRQEDSLRPRSGQAFGCSYASRSRSTILAQDDNVKSWSVSIWKSFLPV